MALGDYARKGPTSGIGRTGSSPLGGTGVHGHSTRALPSVELSQAKTDDTVLRVIRRDVPTRRRCHSKLSSDDGVAESKIIKARLCSLFGYIRFRPAVHICHHWCN